MHPVRSWNSFTNSVFITAALTLLISFSCVHSAAFKKRDIQDYSGNREKKPFCNAFTGCGKKRSSPAGFDAATGAELDELARHVLAEARLWEQLQNKVEMMRTLASQMEEHPLYRRKRSVYSTSADSEPKDDLREEDPDTKDQDDLKQTRNRKE